MTTSFVNSRRAPKNLAKLQAKKERTAKRHHLTERVAAATRFDPADGISLRARRSEARKIVDQAIALQVRKLRARDKEAIE